jgi:hypothetical protein
MRRAWTWWLAWGLCALFTVVTVATIAIDAGTRPPDEQDESFWGDLSLVVAFGAFAVVGALVASRRPRNAVGWLFLAAPLFAIVGAFSEEYAYRALIVNEGELPLGLLFAWFASWMWFPALGAIALVGFVFPDGRLPGRWWGFVLWAFVVVISLTAIGAAVYPGPISETWPGAPEKPLTISGSEEVLDMAAKVGGALLIGLLAALVASVVVRVRRSRGRERQQLKWMLVAVAFLVCNALVSETFTLPDSVGNLLFAISVASLPVAAGVAILKHRLYDVDVVIRKTLVYGALTVLLGAAYVALVLAGQALFASFAGGSDLAIAASTLVVAALFLPLRRRVRRVVDRRFYRGRYDAARTLDAFGSRLREQIDLETLQADLRAVVEETMQPSHASVWLRREVVS